MIRTIGLRKVDPPRDLGSLLLECHERIRNFVALARAIARHDGVTTAQVVDGCERVTRYFSQALPLHVADEEQSIEPRLRQLEPELDAALETMCQQHSAHESVLQSFLTALADLRASPDDRERRTHLGDIAAKLERDFAEHLALEEALIIPAIPRLLSESAEQAILSELRARRERPAPP